MDFVASFYPPLSQRAPIPTLYLPGCILLTLLPFLFRNRLLGMLATFPPLLLLCLRIPYYTFGEPSSDYYSSGVFLAMPLWYLDFVVFCPTTGSNSPMFVGPATQTVATKKYEPRGWTDLTSPMQTLLWAFRLMIAPNRGIGWNWQVKGVPFDFRASLPRSAYLKSHLRRAALTYVRSVVMLVLMGFSSTLQKYYTTGTSPGSLLLDAVIGWSGAIWVWDRLNCFYSLAAVVSVSSGLCETWEWPPLTGQLRDAWSVRQMWSVVYHQVMRRMLQQPALRITRCLGIRKGSLTSRYTQLYISFALSCLYHEFEIFNVTRRDVGEFAFFMSQPLAITAEDCVQWGWRKYRGQGTNKDNGRFERVVGYVWVVVWFSYCLPEYVKGVRDADIIRDAFFGTRPFDIGSELSLALLRSWNG